MGITLNKRAKLPAIIVTAVLLLVTILDSKVFFQNRFKGDVTLYIACILGSFLIGALILFDFNIKNKYTENSVSTVIFFLSPIVIMTMTEALNNIFVYDMTYIGFVSNYVIILIFLLVVYFFSGSYRMPLWIISPFLFVLATANFYVKSFRGTPFIPMDLASTGTAMNVSNEYTFTLSHQVWAAALLLIFLIVLAVKLRSPALNLRSKIVSRALAIVFSMTIVLTFYLTDFFVDMGIKPDFWNQTRGYKRHGFVCSFFVNTKYLFVTTPDGYDADIAEQTIKEMAYQYDKEAEKTETKTPNIICIMNESLSDLSVLGDLETNIEYMPYLNSLKKNTIKGNLFVPVIGAGTSNSEFEFLTGNTTAFLPAGSNSYMLYIKERAASLVSTLNAQNYNSFAFHPYYASGWNRVNVYNAFGFSQFKSLGNLIDLSIMEEYQETNSIKKLQEMVDEKYPNSNMLLRAYISDSYNYKVLIEDYENRDESKPYFVFNVTMQNHGGYKRKADNFAENVWATNVSKDYTKANQYLSLVKYSDDAFKELIEYFSSVDEPVIICMFGDHQPSIEESFVEELLGKKISQLSTEENQKRYTTPFWIWANYDIEEKEIEYMSANYLSSYLLEVAGLELSDYNKFLLQMYKTLPVINTAGYVDNEGNFYSWNDSSKYDELIKKYKYVQHNNMFDNADKLESLFYLGE
ncbi:MAG: sulfatase-like hydrolase/transferase [Clostridia bacterium]|nr:sulfatase-like hydrolase/transferase [Clostridia bacterium]